MPPRKVGGLAVNAALEQMNLAAGGNGLDDTLANMGSTMSTGGVSISRTRGLTVDGASLPEGGRGSLRREDIELEGVLGSGACSVVRLARDRRDRDRRYAVKIFNVFEEAKRHQLVKEVRMLFELDCCALVSFHGAYLDDGGKVGVVLDFMDAGALEDVLRRRAAALPPGAAPGVPELVCASICYQTFWGLAYLHYEQRLHRDIKPGNILCNILLSSNGEAKLSDFGIARDVDDEDAIASTMIGTFRYMSPERLRGDDYSFESDVWSLGMVLLEAARGAPVFPPNCTPVDLTQAFKARAAAAAERVAARAPRPPPAPSAEDELAASAADMSLMQTMCGSSDDDDDDDDPDRLEATFEGDEDDEG
ncbi:MAP kinase kinase [Aureococcus anophagefferens]|nr:MAP kinase kinase [Aureococcus anophagefferens]